MTTDRAALVIGVGASRGATADEIEALIDQALLEVARSGYPTLAPRLLATVDKRLEEPGIPEVARRRGWELLGFPAASLARVTVPNPVAAVRARTGTPSVAEAAALAAAESLGRDAFLVCAKRKSPRATVAVATSFPAPRPNLADGAAGSGSCQPRLRHP